MTEFTCAIECEQIHIPLWVSFMMDWSLIFYNSCFCLQAQHLEWNSKSNRWQKRAENDRQGRWKNHYNGACVEKYKPPKDELSTHCWKLSFFCVLVWVIFNSLQYCFSQPAYDPFFISINVVALDTFSCILEIWLSWTV